MLPIYGALHFVPAVLFKRKAFIRDPGKVLVKAGVGSLRSSAFLGVFIAIYQSKSILLLLLFGRNGMELTCFLPLFYSYILL